MRKIMRKSTFLIPSRSFIYKQGLRLFPADLFVVLYLIVNPAFSSMLAALSAAIT